jgi:uncharacterized repeat protein (TIGR03803 family)
MSKLSLWKTIALVGCFCAAAAIASPAQTFKTLVSFNGTDGADPQIGSLVQGIDGNFYGATWGGGANDYGTVFKISPGGTLTTLYSFCSKKDCTDGYWPGAGLVLATDGNFYGTTIYGGAWCFPNGCGTVFKITPEGTLTTLHSFDGINGSSPSAALVQATDGNFYGTTSGDGAHHQGTVFKITPGGGTLITLHMFGGTCGANPSAGLVQASDGNLYGTTESGGDLSCAPGGCGTVFKITPGGTLTTLHSFDGTDGAFPSGLVQATDGNFYGATEEGGVSGCQAAGYGSCGTVFKITPGGALTTLHSFDFTDGAGPSALIQATDGNFYGATYSGGDGSCFGGCGTVFKITAAGTVTTLHSFDGKDGWYPQAGLLQGTDGNFYGTTGGEYELPPNCTVSCGTVFSLAVGLGPFVKTLPTSGEVGATVIILGTDLTGATSVTFDGTAAAFTVVSSSEITTSVPSGAATGKVEVTTPKGTLVSNVNFRVTPTISDFSPTGSAVSTSVVITGEGW